MKNDIFGLKLTSILKAVFCLIIAFLIWLYFNN